MNNLNGDELLKLLNFEPIIRLGVIVALVFYAIFAFFIIRQTVLMGQVLHTKVAPLLKTIAYLHFIASLLVLLFSLIMLTP